jgi:hypothetical protein
MYTINGKTFGLKDLTIKESRQVNNLLKVSGLGSNLNAEFDNEDAIKKFLQIVLIDVNNESEQNIDFFDDATEKQTLEIVKDFFLRKVNSMKEMQSDLIDSMKKQKQ